MIFHYFMSLKSHQYVLKSVSLLKTPAEPLLSQTRVSKSNLMTQNPIRTEPCYSIKFLMPASTFYDSNLPPAPFPVLQFALKKQQVQYPVILLPSLQHSINFSLKNCQPTHFHQLFYQTQGKATCFRSQLSTQNSLRAKPYHQIAFTFQIRCIFATHRH